MATIEELEGRVKRLEETILIQGDILKRILEILSSMSNIKPKQPKGGDTHRKEEEPKD